MFEIFTDQETISEDRIDGGPDVRVLGSKCPQLNNPCNPSNPTFIDVLIWGA